MKANVAAMILIFALTALFQSSPHRASAPGPSGPVKGVSPSTAESGTSATADLTEIVAKPGDEVHFSIQLNYTAVQPITTITYSLRTQYLPSDWTARIWYKGQEIRGITVSNKKLPDKLDLEIDIPETAEVGNYSFWFLAIGRESVAESAILQLQVEVKALKREVKLSCDHPSVGLDSDGVARFSLTLNNFGDVDERLNLTCEAPSGWKALFKEQTKTIYEIIIPASASKKVEVEAMPPAYAAPGVYCLSVSGLSGDRASSSTLDLKVVVLESAERVVSALYPELSEEAGKKITFPITLKNLGAGSDIYRISTSSLPSGWVSYFRTAPGSSTSVSSVTLEGGKSTDLYLEIVPPKAVEVGTYNIPVLVTSDSGATYAIDLKATIVGSYDLTLKSSTLLTSVTSGATTTFTATVTNTG
ncbi:MAG: hypothetical protein JTT11_08295, partial [Candidatus Brockarchaeota archaeon]|nr:hypothetical protein [Candidatus Brockarchaeota archaeon]